MGTSLPIPEHIRNNIVYNDAWNRIKNNDLNVNYIIIGNPGSGKSRLGLRICKDLDPSFSVERVCYDNKTFMNLVYNGDSKGPLGPGCAILYDEVVTDEGAEARNFMSKGNKMMASVIATFRAKRLITVFCLPKLRQLDINVRDVGLTGLFNMQAIDRNKGLALAKFYWGDLDALSGVPLRKFPRVDTTSGMLKVKGIWWKKAYPELWAEYRERKFKFLIELGQRYHGELEARDVKDAAKIKRVKRTHSDMIREIQAEPDKFKTYGKYDWLKILDHFSCSESKAHTLAKYVKINDAGAGVAKSINT